MRWYRASTSWTTATRPDISDSLSALDISPTSLQSNEEQTATRKWEHPCFGRNRKFQTPSWHHVPSLHHLRFCMGIEFYYVYFWILPRKICRWSLFCLWSRTIRWHSRSKWRPNIRYADFFDVFCPTNWPVAQDIYSACPEMWHIYTPSCSKSISRSSKSLVGHKPKCSFVHSTELAPQNLIWPILHLSSLCSSQG